MDQVIKQSAEDLKVKVDALLEKYPHNLRKAAKILVSETGWMTQKLALRCLQARMLTNLGL